MRRATLHRLRLLVLAALLGLGTSLSAVQAGVMPVQMAMEQPAPGSDECGGCAGCEGDGHTELGSCLSFCAAATQALPPDEPVAALPARTLSFQPVDRPAVGFAPSPDPDPPRALVLG